jgi:hypothetical protein
MYSESDSTGEAASLVRQAHQHRGMSEVYRLAVARPWLPVWPSFRCDCRVCAEAGGPSHGP